VASRRVLVAYNAQVRLLPNELVEQECGLVEIGRQHARNFDAGHAPSGAAAQRMLSELRKLAERMASRATETATPVISKLDDLRARRAARLTDTQNREHPVTGD
jgi:cell division septum initiation protein DivIVA